MRSRVESFVVVSFLAIYFSSGFAALLYQVIWQRLLAIFSGADLFATTTVVASFMAGLGIGSVCGGAVADRVSVRWQLGLFALAEALTGIFGWISAWWYYDILYKQFGHIPTSSFWLAAILFGSLLVPTFLMGMTLPLLSKALTPAVELAGQRIGSLYALNTLGAAAGALTTAWILMGRIDFQHILRIGAVVNFAAAVIAVALGAFVKTPKAEPGLPDTGGQLPPARASAFSFSGWAAIYGLSGFVALSLEMIWFRTLGVMLKSNSFTFPHLLGIYLACLAVGLFLGSRLVRFAKRTAEVFFALQAGIVIYAGLSIAFLVWGLEHVSALEWLRSYLGGYEPFDVIPARRGIGAWIDLTAALPSFASLYLLVPLFLIAPPTLMMGLSFPFLQKTVQTNHHVLGRRVGWLQGSNILGSTLGSIVVGGVLLELIGTSWTLKVLIALGGTFLILCIHRIFPLPSASRRVSSLVAAMGVIVVIVALPSGSGLWAALHGSTDAHVIVTEAASGLSVLKNQDPSFSSTTWVYVNGLGQSWIPYHDVSVIHSRLGALPVLLHPDPREIAVIGLGSGDTLFSLGGREETREITCIEIVGSQLEGLRLLHEKRPYGGLDTLLGDSRIKYVTGDGRRYLASGSKKYDIIEADALRPNSAFGGNLYSIDYFQLLRSRLKPGGYALTWAPTHRTLETFMRVFPYVLNFDSVVIGSETPIEYDRDTIFSRLDRPFTRAYYERAGLNMDTVVREFFDARVDRVRMDHRQFSLADWNTDLFPKDEYPR